MQQQCIYLYRYIISKNPGYSCKSQSKAKIYAFMSLKINRICLNCSILIPFLLIFQVAFAQSDFGDVDALLQRNQKTLGNEVVALIYKDGKIVHQKELGEFNAKTQA